MPRTVENKQLQLGSMSHWIDMSKKAGVDAQIGNHPLHFDGPARLFGIAVAQRRRQSGLHIEGQAFFRPA